MQPRFNIERERDHRVFCQSYRNDKCLFQFHSQIEIYFVDEGEMEMFVSGHRRVLKQGEISVALSYETHAYKTPTESRSSVLLIPSQLCEEFAATVKGKRLATPFITDPVIYERLKRYYAVLNEQGVGSVRQLGYLYVILGLILEHVGLMEVKAPIDTELASSILFYIAENFKSGITPASVAAHFGYSQSYLSRYFKACFDITLGRYLTVIKLKNAVMLMHEGRDITYCAMESGFASMRTFYRTFHDEFGCAPKDYHFTEH